MSPAAMLLDPKAYSKQLALGNSSSSSTSPIPTELAAGENSSSHPTPPHSISAAPLGDDNKAYSSHEGRRGSQSPGSRSSQQNGTSRPTDISPLGTTFDPRQLLSPRSYSSKSSRSSNATPTRKGHLASDDIQKKRDLEDHGNAGQGSLIENMYGLETRPNQPLKKRKTDEESTIRSASNFSASGNAGLGEYMKEEAATAGSKELAIRSSVIDLTLGKFVFLLSPYFLTLGLIPLIFLLCCLTICDR